MANWLHRLLNPHCVHCIEERHEQKECHNCDVLTQLLERERANNAKLIDQLVAPKVIEKVVERPQIDRTPVRAITPTWAVRQQMLENEDRAKAEILRKHEIKPTDEIEKELGISNG